MNSNKYLECLFTGHKSEKITIEQYIKQDYATCQNCHQKIIIVSCNQNQVGARLSPTLPRFKSIKQEKNYWKWEVI